MHENTKSNGDGYIIQAKIKLTKNKEYITSIHKTKGRDINYISSSLKPLG